MLRFLLPLSGFVVSAAALTVIQPPAGASYLAWVAIVPFVLACSASAKNSTLAAASYVTGAAYWLGNIYWVGWVTQGGWIALSLYLALLWPALALCVRFCRKAKLPLTLSVPILFVGAERLQGLFLGGFFWRLLAHSQYANLSLIQIADIFGAGGVSFLVAMVNGLIAEVVTIPAHKRTIPAGTLIRTALVLACAAASIVYGRWRIAQTAEVVEQGPAVAAVQSNVPQSVKNSCQASDRILADLLDKSSQSAAAGADLVVWPETMVQAVLDPRLMNMPGRGTYSAGAEYDKVLRGHAIKTGAYILVGAYGAEPARTDAGYIELKRRYNSAFLYTPQGRQADVQYDKIRLVPFGEKLPFRNSWPAFHNLLMKLTPYDYDYSLDSGSRYTLFEMSVAGKDLARRYRFGAMICYEDAIPSIARRFADYKATEKGIHWLVNISNDGWFIRPGGEGMTASTELVQHAVVCVFRAVENRLAVVRSVNTGISCLIDTTGGITNGFSSGSLPGRALDRKAVEGWFLDRVPVDSRATFFSKHGRWLDFCCAACLVMLIMGMLTFAATGRRHRRAGRRSHDEAVESQGNKA